MMMMDENAKKTLQLSTKSFSNLTTTLPKRSMRLIPAKQSSATFHLKDSKSQQVASC